MEQLLNRNCENQGKCKVWISMEKMKKDFVRFWIVSNEFIATYKEKTVYLGNVHKRRRGVEWGSKRWLYSLKFHHFFSEKVRQLLWVRERKCLQFGENLLNWQKWVKVGLYSSIRVCLTAKHTEITQYL